MEMSFSAQEEAFAAARRAHFTELHCFVQTWILTFHDIGALNAQLDEAQTAVGEVRTATVEPTACPAVLCISPAKSSSPR